MNLQFTPFTDLRRALASVAQLGSFLAVVFIASHFIAWLAAALVRSTVAATVLPFAWLDRGDRLAALFELFHDNPAVLPVFLYATTISIVSGTALWTVLYPGLAHRLRAKASFADLGAHCIRGLPAMVAQSCYGLGLRAALGVPVVLVCVTLGLRGIALVPLWLVWTIATLAHDRARGSVVLYGAAAFDPRVLARSLSQVLSRPQLLVPGAGLTLLQVAMSAAVLLVALAGPYAFATTWIVRGLGAATLVVGLWRVALGLHDLERS